MDPLAKRNMWRTLSRFVPHRSILLTTHSMEEADALADRVGVLAKHMLDVGTTAHLRQKHGHGFHIHIVLANGVRTTPEEADRVQHWIEEKLPGSIMERACWHGQMRFNVPSSPPETAPADEISVGSIFILLEENKDSLGLAFHSVSPSTFDEVFLKVVEKHGVGEEDLVVGQRAWGDIFVNVVFFPMPQILRWLKRRRLAQGVGAGVGAGAGVAVGAGEGRQEGEVVGVGAGEQRQEGEGDGVGVVEGEGVTAEREGEARGPAREVAAPPLSSGFSLWPPPLYTLIRNSIQRRRATT
jgi:energy-coupling factor transporter ATP-binding protein EcfA2